MARKPTFKQLLKMFRNGRVSARQINIGPDYGWATRWKPSVAGRTVRNSIDPDLGFESRAEAIEAAKRYRESCRNFSGQKHS